LLLPEPVLVPVVQVQVPELQQTVWAQSTG